MNVTGSQWLRSNCKTFDSPVLALTIYSRLRSLPPSPHTAYIFF